MGAKVSDSCDTTLASRRLRVAVSETQKKVENDSVPWWVSMNEISDCLRYSDHFKSKFVTCSPHSVQNGLQNGSERLNLGYMTVYVYCACLWLLSRHCSWFKFMDWNRMDDELQGTPLFKTPQPSCLGVQRGNGCLQEMFPVCQILGGWRLENSKIPGVFFHKAMMSSENRGGNPYLGELTPRLSNDSNPMEL